jgi:hypothetical protein
MKPFLLGFFEQNQLFCIVGRNFISGRWVELVWWGSYKSHDNRCTVCERSEGCSKRITASMFCSFGNGLSTLASLMTVVSDASVSMSFRHRLERHFALDSGSGTSTRA